MHSTHLIVAAGVVSAAVASLAHGQFNYPYYDTVYTVPYQPAGAPVTTPIAVAPFVSPNGEALYHVIGATAVTLRAQLFSPVPFSGEVVSGISTIDVSAFITSNGAPVSSSNPISGWFRESVFPSSPIVLSPQPLLQTISAGLSVPWYDPSAALFTGTDPIGVTLTMRGNLAIQFPQSVSAVSEVEARLYVRYFFIPSPGTGAALGLGLCVGHGRRRNGRGGGSRGSVASQWRETRRMCASRSD